MLKYVNEKLQNICKSRTATGFFVRTSKYWKDENTLVLNFLHNSKSFIAAEFISVQTRESKKQLAKLYMPVKERNRGPVVLVT